MMKKILSALTAVCCVFALSACCCTEEGTATPEETKEPAGETVSELPDPEKITYVEVVDDAAFEVMMGEQPDPAGNGSSSTDLLCKEGFTGYFHAKGKVVFENAPDSTRYARLYGKMNELPFFEWLVTDDGPRPYRYRFLLAGKDGSRTFSPVETRMITPGDAVRFSVKVPAGCTGAILLLDKAD